MYVMLSYHYVQEALATEQYLYSFTSVVSRIPLTFSLKHWAHQDVYPVITKPILFYGGDKKDLLKEAGKRKRLVWYAYNDSANYRERQRQLMCLCACTIIRTT